MRTERTTLRFSPLACFTLTIALTAGCTILVPSHSRSTKADDTGSSGGAPSDPCVLFIGCAGAVAPDTSSDANANYGGDGACWRTQSVAACDASCKGSLETLHRAFPASSECALCKSNADCAGATPVCSADTGECVECDSSDDCTAPSELCNTTSHTCGACLSNGDCGASKVCDVANGRCEECVLGSDCPSKSCGPDHACCVAISPCVATVCGAMTDNCGQQVTCGGCGSGKYCDEQQTHECQVLSTQFECNVPPHDGVMCNKYTSFCEEYESGGSHCQNQLPPQCAQNVTCACLLAANVYAPPSFCEDGTGPDGVGEVIVSIPD